MIDLNDVAPARASLIQYDLDAIVADLRAGAATWVPQHFRKGRRNDDEWRLANINGAPPHKSGSCVIKLGGEHAGDWFDFDGGQGGGPLSTLEHATGLKGRDLFAYAADLAGWSAAAPAGRWPLVAKPVKDPSQEIAIILSRATAIAGTPGEAYLGSRGLALPEGCDLLYHPDLAHWESRTGFPAIVGLVRDRNNAVIALHRIYLRPDGAAKAEVANPKKMLGRVGGGAVRLAPLGDNAVLGLSEGIETALAVMTSCPGMAVWASLSANNLEQVVLPPEARHVVVLADHDASGAGIRAAHAAARRLVKEGRTVSIALPPREGDDFNDVLLRDGVAGVRQIVDAAVPYRLPAAVDATDRTYNRPIGFVEPQRPLPLVRADEGDLARAHADAWNLLLASNSTPWLFRSAGVPTWVVHDDEGLPIAMPVTEERLRHMLAHLADWRRLARNGQLVPAHPPTPIIKSLLATPDPGLPVLTGIVSTPVFGRNGTLLTSPGYHRDARLLYQPVPGFVVPDVPVRPSPAEISSARRLIVEDMLGDFPFTGIAEQAHAVALLLLGFLRAMIDAPTPLHLIEKPTPGTGATLMVDAIATVLTGVSASVMTESRDDDEWRKRLTAKLRQIPSMVLIDNLRHRLNSSALAAALTAPYWEDRVLGASETVRLPIRCIWIATGNNPEFSNEMARRIVRIRLDAGVDQPFRREGFRHPDLMGWVRANRPRLVAACLTLCRAWIAAGQPRGTRIIGSYETWSRIMSGVLEVAGINGFLDNLDEMLDAADGEGAIWRSFIKGWWDRFGTAEVGTGDLYEVALSCEPPLPLGSGGDRSQRTRLGKALAHMRDRVFELNDRKIRVNTLGVSHQAKKWQLMVEGERGERFPHDAQARGGERAGLEGNIENQRSPAQPSETIEQRERGERGERFSDPSHARGCAHTKEDGHQRSPRSPCSPMAEVSGACGGEREGERLSPCSPEHAVPDWLKEVL